MLCFPFRPADHALVAPRGGHAGHRDDLLAAYDERPGLALGTRHLRVHEQVLHLLTAARKTIAGAPRSDVEARQVGLDRPGTPANTAAEGHRALLEPEAVLPPRRAEASAPAVPPRHLTRKAEPA